MKKLLRSLTWIFRLHPAWIELEAENKLLRERCEQLLIAQRLTRQVIDKLGDEIS